MKQIDWKSCKHEWPSQNCIKCGTSVSQLLQNEFNPSPEADPPEKEPVPSAEELARKMWEADARPSVLKILPWDQLVPATKQRWTEWAKRALDALRPSPPASETPQHVCGLAGYGALGDTCPACQAREKTASETGGGKS